MWLVGRAVVLRWLCTLGCASCLHSKEYHDGLGQDDYAYMIQPGVGGEAARVKVCLCLCVKRTVYNKAHAVENQDTSLFSYTRKLEGGRALYASKDNLALSSMKLCGSKRRGLKRIQNKRDKRAKCRENEKPFHAWVSPAKELEMMLMLCVQVISSFFSWPEYFDMGGDILFFSKNRISNPHHILTKWFQPYRPKAFDDEYTKWRHGMQEVGQAEAEASVVTKCTKCSQPKCTSHFGWHTSSPTMAPTTPQPTHSPTFHPTSPTLEPTLAPTEHPTLSPTENPTLRPTPAPTIRPTRMPTLAWMVNTMPEMTKFHHKKVISHIRYFPITRLYFAECREESTPNACSNTSNACYTGTNQTGADVS